MKKTHNHRTLSRPAICAVFALFCLIGSTILSSSSLARQAHSDLTKQVRSAGLKSSAASAAKPGAGLASSKSILIYGPSLDSSAAFNEQSVAQASGYSVTVGDEATWSTMTTEQFAAFNAIVFGDPSCNGGLNLLATANATKTAWSRAITGSVYIQGTDPVFHQMPGGQILITDGIDFAAAGAGTGLYVSLSCYYQELPPDTAVDFLSAIGDFKVSDECADQVTIVNPTHPAMVGLTNSSLSNWDCSVHESITSFPSKFEVLTTANRSSDGTAVAYIIASTPIPARMDDAGTFVAQHYRDFLNREPDADGLAFWTNEINSCGGDAQCVDVKRINVSAAYFLSIEFQQTGYLVYRMYKSSYGNLSDAQVPITLNEFLPDTKKIGQGVIVNQSGWEQTLENNKQAFAAEFVQRSRFASPFPTSMTPDQFVDALFANAGFPPSSADRTNAISEFGSASTTIDVAARGRALRRVAENSMLAQQEFNRAFVLMQYFGYLRRNPNDAPEATLDFQGYNFWLNKLNSFDGNFQNAEMVKAFITSSEYRQRFGP